VHDSRGLLAWIVLHARVNDDQRAFGDGAQRRTTPDTFAIVIRDSANSIVFSASGPLKGGNIKIH